MHTHTHTRTHTHIHTHTHAHAHTQYTESDQFSLNKLTVILPLRSAIEPQVSEEKIRQWYQRVEVGVKEFILSLEDSRLESFSFDTHNYFMLTFHGLESQISMSVKRAEVAVNTTRKINCLPEIQFSIAIGDIIC